MKKFTLDLNEDDQRPIVILRRIIPLEAMLDTGAILPVWVSSPKLLKAIGGLFDRANVPFGGFGGITKGDLYLIPNFRVGELVFPYMPIILSPHNLPCKMILSATMFNSMMYEIDNINHRLNVSVPDTESLIRNLKIEDKNGSIHIFCTSA